MTKNLMIITLLILLSAGLFVSAKDLEPEGMFPALEGFSLSGAADFYTPDTLFEYINGGADLFLTFDFVKLYSQRYRNKNGGEITADVYIHETLADGFGIYAQERPEKGNFIQIGSEGYYEEGTLNFFKGPYYVKISSFDLGENDRQILTTLASAIAGHIHQKEGFPELFSRFDRENRVPGSDKFTNINFMGHSFLNGVFSRDYSVGGKTFTFFVIEGTDAREPEAVLEKYTDFIKGKGGQIIKAGNTVQFTDPYYRNSGKMNLMIRGNLLMGMFSDDASLFSRLAAAVIK